MYGTLAAQVSGMALPKLMLMEKSCYGLTWVTVVIYG